LTKQQKESKRNKSKASKNRPQSSPLPFLGPGNSAVKTRRTLQNESGDDRSEHGGTGNARIVEPTKSKAAPEDTWACAIPSAEKWGCAQRSDQWRGTAVSLRRASQATGSVGRFRDLLAANRRGKGLGIYSLCSANRFVLEAGMLQAARDESLLLIESTSNQVNQFGGYTGQTPAEFAKFVHEIAAGIGYPGKQIVLGGDHLGPHVWRNVPAATAMEKAREMVAEYVRAGFCKIHLDASMPCLDDPVDPGHALPDEIVSLRAAELCKAAEDAHRDLPRSAPLPVYVIGTEVPLPGGEQFGSKAPEVTRTKHLAHTLAVSQRAFFQLGLEAAWERVIAVVVQPGVEFGDSTVFAYDPRKAKPLSHFLMRAWTGVYEAHSTDYQRRAALRQMVVDHFAILKVGPWLTFAFREAVFALATIENELLTGSLGTTLSGLPDILENAMLENPVHWKSYYQGTGRELMLARKYSYSDRARYYWPQASVATALERLVHNLNSHPAPHSLLSQYLPRQADAVRAGELPNRPIHMIHHKIQEVLDQYAFACGMVA
jgi:D-tagatose-1,6-bisphosphate aldolase subunit GatZ/KbaZ